jgi:toxin ParE1/3/4
MTGPLELLWSGLAIKDLLDMVDYISQDNPRAAYSLANRIKSKILRLQRFPLSGRVVPEFSEKGYREVVVYPYRIVYDVCDDNVIVLRVWHGKRDLKNIDSENQEDD